MTDNTPLPESKAEQRRRHTLERRSHNAAEVLGAPSTEVLVRQQLSFLAQTQLKALPPDMVRQGLIQFDPQGQPRVAGYDPALLAPNPQRARVVDRGLAELAASLDAHGQQEPLLARLLTDTDRARWPDAFTDTQLLLILKGHRLYYAQPRSKVRLLKVELLLPFEGEDDLAYSRRALRRASIKLMHSQAYDIFDKVNLYQVWREEYALTQPKDAEVAAYFEISRTEAQRVKAVAQLDPAVAQEIINSDKRPADEVVFAIANRPPEEHRDAYDRFGHLTVAAVRKLLQQDKGGKAEAKVTGAGRPRNYVLAVKDEATPLTYISTNLTPQQWQEKGGAKAFWHALQQLGNSRDFHDRLENDLD